MTSDQTEISPTKRIPRWAPLLSLVIPGSGQLVQKKTWRGVAILLLSIILGFLVYWSYSTYEIGKIELGSGCFISWLWIPFILFHLWNILDAFEYNTRKKAPLILAIVNALIILFVIGWIVTDVKLDRLVTRIDDAKIVIKKLANPDFFSTYEGDKEVVCGWNCIWTYLGAKIKGEPTGEVFVSANAKRLFGQQGTITARTWQVIFSGAERGTRIPGFETGTIVETIAIGLMATLFSTVFAIPVSFLAAHNIMKRVPGGNVIYYITRGILNFTRAVDTVVWGLIVIVWVGLGSFAGVIALTIHSVAALAKLLSEEIEHIDAGPVEAIEATGGNFIQVLRYAVIPQIIPSFLSYTLLRWDINMRSATVVGFVAGGGIGFFVLETIRLGGYQQYASALWAVAVVIILVDLISSRWRFNIMKDQPQKVGKTPTWKKVRNIIYVLLGSVLFIYFWDVTRIDLKDLFNPGPTFGRLLMDFITIDVSGQVVNNVVRELIITVMQAFMATTLGGLLAIPFSFLAAKNLTGKSVFSAWLFYLTRAVFNILRSIEALLYVAIFVFWVGIGPFAGMLALAITTFALMGKLYSEAIENIDPGPIEAITATGANRMQSIVYAIVPQIVPPFLSYLIYQWDINIRMATIIGFAGGGGIGLMLSTFFGSLQYHKAGTVILTIVLIVAAMDFSSAKIREKFV